MTSRIFGIVVLVVCLLASSASAVAGDSPLVDDIAPFKAALIQKLDGKQFAELEQLESQLRQGKARFAGGDWKLFHFYETLAAGHVLEHAPIESDWLGAIGSLKEWQAHSPKSAVPLLLLAEAYTDFAWYARGTGRSGTVKEAMWSAFKDRLNQGAFHLNLSQRVSPGHPQWFVVALKIARGLEWPRDRAETLITQAAASEPLYQHAYSMMAVYLLPRWHGEPGEWEAFAQATADRIGGLEGSAVYNHILLTVSHQHGNTEFFDTNDVSWRKVQWSFADREKRYGTGIQSLNHMLRLAGGVKDKPAARAFMKRVGDNWDQSVWRTRQNFDRFKNWVDGDEK